ncbi:Fibronectin type III domain-containing protein [Geodermatophilus pulveris]|uniref:Fibronectin type III domain-containing protein n=1 Tax=Geodermatophilus pulveris TaxID=1564159 RepID=A0A239B1R1_9ACTN|nr:fibronectin type III domain-containing protein [Geodermatophilus pulveris]SNS01168.1 Fibronectin type III domain-containing protein [Geodermatophilus pulveris]
MSRTRRWHAPLTTLLAAVALVLGSGAAVATAAPVSTTATWAASPARPFSDPLWFPLREPARVSCTHSNPGTPSYPEGCDGYHGYWAMDLLGDKGDPVHAAGAGILRIGARDTSCRTSGTESSGTWVWVDHGGGVVTKYNHLDSITTGLEDGDLVTPATQIGRMGSTGDTAPCTTNYLHFEVRTGGITGPRVDPGPLLACESTGRKSYPGHWGYRSWNDLPKAQQWTPTLSNDCLPGSAATSSAPTSVSTTRSDRTVRVAWKKPTTVPSALDRYTISREVWGPSVGKWHSMSYRTVPASQLATTFSGLDNGRTYRFRVTAHTTSTTGAGGTSAWTAAVKAIPAAAPLAPRTDRKLVAGTSYVRFGWYGSVPRGTPVTSYKVGIRYWTGSAWSGWSFVRVPAAELTHRWDGLRRGTTYQVMVRANSDAGASPWGATRKVTTLR